MLKLLNQFAQTIVHPFLEHIPKLHICFCTQCSALQSSVLDLSLNYVLERYMMNVLYFIFLF